jgi:phosphate-selective porin OprO/OprP
MQLDGIYLGDSLQLSYNARLASTPWYDDSSEGRGYFHWAVAGMVANPDGDVDPRDTNMNEARFRTRPEARTTSRWIDTGPISNAHWYEILGLESLLNLGPLQICGEYQSNWVQRDPGQDVFFHGAYFYASCFLTGEHQPFDRETGQIDRAVPFENFFLVERCRGGVAGGWGAWQVALRYSYLDLSDGDILGGDENNVTFALNWLWTPHAKMQFNYLYGDIRDHAAVNGFTGGHFQIAGTRFMIDF